LLHSLPQLVADEVWVMDKALVGLAALVAAEPVEVALAVPQLLDKASLVALARRLVKVVAVAVLELLAARPLIARDHLPMAA
jgi:hypothetical protein